MLPIKSSRNFIGTIFSICLFSISHLEGAWSTPVMISSITSDQPDIAVDISGNAVAIWQGFDGANYMIQSAVLPKGGSWSSPTDISGSGQNAQSPEVAVDRIGNAVAIWSIFDGTYSVVQGASLPFNGSWTTPVTISFTGGNADSQELAMDSSGSIGNAVAVWHRFNGSNFIIQSSTLPSGGTWSSPVNISVSGEDALVPEIAADPSGNAVVTYCRYDGVNFTTRSSTQLYNQSWSPSSILSNPGNTVNQPVVSVDANGNAIAVWSQFNGINYIIKSSYLPFGGSWSATIDLSAAGGDAYAAKVALDPSGNAIAVWIKYDGTNYVAQASTLPVGGNWSTPSTISDTGQNIGDIDIKVDALGNAIVIWDRTDGVNSSIQSVRLPFNGSWTTPIDVSTSGVYAYLPVLGVDSKGNAVAIWLESNGTTIIVASSTMLSAG